MRSRSRRAQGDMLFKCMPARFKAFIGGDIRSPAGLSLARSALTECQAFSHGPNAWGIRFI
jgi:hypothetical protein